MTCWTRRSDAGSRVAVRALDETGVRAVTGTASTGRHSDPFGRRGLRHFGARPGIVECSCFRPIREYIAGLGVTTATVMARSEVRTIRISIDGGERTRNNEVFAESTEERGW